MLGADGGIPDIVEDLGGEGRAGKKERKRIDGAAHAAKLKKKARSLACL